MAAGKTFNRISTGIVLAILAGAFWTFGSHIFVRAPHGPSSSTISRESGTEVSVGPSGLAVPVDGVAPTQLYDSFNDARGGGTRVHQALDIMAPEGTPVIAAADGTVEKLFFSKGGGGITIYVRSPDKRWMYYYAHLQGYAPGLAEGQQVRRGQVIGRVGHTGDASPQAPHLHFAINRMDPGEGWWKGTPINPYPLLAGKKGSG